MNFDFKGIFSEANGTPSSIRILLGIAVFAVISAIVYLLVHHFLTGVMTDLPPNVANLLTWLVSVLAGSKAASKFGEAPPNKPNDA
jgi:hypothetical protein